MSKEPAERIPVIVGVGEIADHPDRPEAGLEPGGLMAEALRRAEADAGARLLAALDSLDVINEVSWPYPDICGLLEARLGIRPQRSVYHPVGGQTPVLAIHEAALRISAGESQVAAVCGAEAEQTVRQAAKLGAGLPWAAKVEDFQPVRGAAYQRPVARKLGISTPTNVYPFYENATRAAWGQGFEAAQRESATIWARNAAVAAGRPAAWIRRPVTADDILEVTRDNRWIAWPYPKLMVANPIVNQGAAVLLTSLARARAAGVPDERLVFLWGGAAADAPRDILDRCGYASSPEMEAALGGAQAVARAGGAEAFDKVELYSCFPCVPKMARRTLGLGVEDVLTQAGGLTFFGAPLNNYMTHAAVAMVEALRRDPGVGLLYGQGEYVTKHHALVVASEPPRGPLAPDYRRQPTAAEAPVLLEDYEGPAVVETYTVLFERSGAVAHGVVIARTPGGERLMLRVPASDADTLGLLMDAVGEPVGATGAARLAADGVGEWRHG